ncbi:phage tail protein [Marinifilum flexuosum]|uniref:phage tail protein n=1 Tax=Marinifilum flexuosum TaxID=1117708 RepID=UPI002493ED6F|nr:phage tail protein [Marinifilum flexuosum]
MSEDKTNATWPSPKFYFEVKLESGVEAKFHEVAGLDLASEGGLQSANVSLKKGIFRKTDNFFKWYDSFKMNTMNKCTVLIRLLDESGKPAMSWKLHNAWPTRILSPDFKEEGDEVAIELLEMAYEGMETDGSGANQGYRLK